MRILKKITALTLSLLIALTIFTGCSIVSKDGDRDLKQVITTVQIDSTAPITTIYKKDMAFNYLMTSSYESVQNGDSTLEEEMSKIYDTLLQNAVLTQVAMKEFNEENVNIENASITDVWNIDRYLTEAELAEIYYNTNKSINGSIDTYLEDEEIGKTEDTSTAEIRGVPTGAENKSNADNANYYKAYNSKAGTLEGKGVNAGFIKNADGTISLNSDENAQERRDAYNSLLKSLSGNFMLNTETDSFDFEEDTIYDTYYYNYSINAQKIDTLINKWKSYKSANIMSSYTYEELCAYYQTNVYQVQKNSYDALASNYATALESQSATSPVVYNPYSGYGYVYNLLLGVDDVQTAEIAAIDETLTAAEKSEERNAILSKTTVKDLRDSWIGAGYDAEFTETDADAHTGTISFINDYSYYKGPDKLSFKGVVEWDNYVAIDDREDDYESNAKVVSTTKYTLNDFIDSMESWLYGNTQVSDSVTTAESLDYYKVVKSNADNADWDEKIKDLLFAFSTDGGSLTSTYKGYLVKPNVDVDENEQYVGEFQQAAKKVLELGAAGNTSSYVMVATQYGYHIIFYSESIQAGTNYDTLEKYLVKAANDYGTFEMDGVAYNSFVEYFNYALNLSLANIESATTENWKAFYNYMINNINLFKEGGLSDFYLYTLQQGRSTYYDSALNDLIEETMFNYMYDANWTPLETYVKIYKDRFEDYFKYEYLQKQD